MKSLSLTLVLFLALGAVFFAPPQGIAATPQAGTQVPGFYRLMVGDLELTALNDGSIELDGKLLLNTTEDEIRRLFDEAFIHGTKVRTAINAFLINTGEKLILVDTGASGAFGPTSGHLLTNLKASGYSPDQVDVVLLTHLHPDHINGLLTPEGALAFPKATIMTAKTECDFWLSPEKAAQAPDAAKDTFTNARRVAEACQKAGKWETFEHGQELFPGIVAEATIGHTPGHSAYLLSSKGSQLLIIGDCIHVGAAQFANPGIAIQFDSDAKQAVATRLAVFARAAREALLVAGMHLAFPGIGRIKAVDQGFRWVPIDLFPQK
jgi:glyoxylase-like metal-dependent hydrolase (beta-lactamase superfamily II)